MWTENTGFYMQLLHFCLSLGAMISPLVAQPFLAHEQCEAVETDFNDNITITPVDNMSQGTGAYIHQAVYEINNTRKSKLNNCDDLFVETNVMYVYLLTASLLALTSAPFFADIYISEHIVNKIDDKEYYHAKEFQSLSVYLKVVILGSLSLMLLLYCGGEMSFAGFLSTFTILHLKWSKRKGAFATSINWICFGITRFAAIFFVRCARTVTILCIFSVLLAISHTCLLISTSLNIEPLILISIGMIGASMSAIFPAVFTWTAESVAHVSGNIASLFLASCSIGVIVFPLVFGYTMDLLSPLWFLYLLIGESTLWVLLFLVTLLVLRRLLTPLIMETELSEKEPFDPECTVKTRGPSGPGSLT